MLRVPTEAVKRDLVVVGASAGGVESLRTLVSELPGNPPAAVVVVLHVAATGRSVLPSILSRAGEMAASHPEDGEPIEQGKIYVAPPDRHIVGHANSSARATRWRRRSGRGSASWRNVLPSHTG